MYYIIINGSKQYLPKKMVEKYGFKPGMRTPFTGFKIFEDNEKEEKTIAGHQEVHQAPEDDNSKISQG